MVEVDKTMLNKIYILVPENSTRLLILWLIILRQQNWGAEPEDGWPCEGMVRRELLGML